MFSLLIIAITASCVLAVYRWRWGVVAAIVIGLLQDPWRKLVPGTPSYLAMASVPVWIAVMASALFANQLQIGTFLNNFPRFGRAVVWFGAYLLLPAVLSATYGVNSWQITLLGALTYTMAFLGLAAGWNFSRDDNGRMRLISFYAISASILLIGGPVEYLGWGGGHAAIGTESMGHVWVTHRTGEAVYMLAGFFRGPDVMGWHASLVFMISIIMAFRSRGAMRFFWVALGVWGLLGIWLCGRRKMLAMVPVFVGLYLFMIFAFKDVRKLLPVVGLLIMTAGVGWLTISMIFHTEEVETFYLSTLLEAEDQVRRHGYDSVIATVKQAGFFGFGLGMGQQGVRHIRAEKPRLWQESGPTKLVAELGVPGSILFLYMMCVLFVTAFYIMRNAALDASFYISAGLLAILGANLVSAIVSAQIYGDPLVALLLSLLTGMLMSGARITGNGAKQSG